jgi:hypothetical protein
VAVALAESGGNTTARNVVNNPGSVAHQSIDRGLWQINSYWHREVSNFDADEPYKATGHAFRISGLGLDFSPWSVFTSGSYQRHLVTAAGAVNRMTTRYPFGYGTQMLTQAELETKETVAKLHPEHRRRVFALMEGAAQAGLQLGIGTGWRVQPSGKPGFAEPGNSYHEGFMPGGQSRPDGVHDTDAMACDMVPSSSWAWMDANAHRYGLRHFANVNNEPWHIQPAEIPGSRNFATKAPPLVTFPLPDAGHAVETPPPPEEPEMREFCARHTVRGDAYYAVDGSGVTRVQLYTADPDVKVFQALAPKLPLTDAQIEAFDTLAGDAVPVHLV